MGTRRPIHLLACAASYGHGTGPCIAWPDLAVSLDRENRRMYALWPFWRRERGTAGLLLIGRPPPHHACSRSLILPTSTHRPYLPPLFAPLFRVCRSFPSSARTKIRQPITAQRDGFHLSTTPQNPSLPLHAPAPPPPPPASASPSPKHASCAARACAAAPFALPCRATVVPARVTPPACLKLCEASAVSCHDGRPAVHGPIITLPQEPGRSPSWPSLGPCSVLQRQRLTSPPSSASQTT